MSRREATVELVVALLLLAAATLLYLEWWRSGELELLNRRVDELDELARKRQTRTRKPNSNGD